MGRNELIDQFLGLNKYEDYGRHPLTGDASNRRYERLVHAKHTGRILMDSDPSKGEDVAPFVQLTDILRNFEFSAPELYHHDVPNGLLVLEDLGDALYARFLENHPEKEDALYQNAVDLLLNLHQKPVVKGIHDYSNNVYLREASLFPDWYLSATLDDKNIENISTQFHNIMDSLLTKLPNHMPVLVLRDYHAENLIWLPNRNGLAKVGLLDYQDALVGNPAYDLVSLLEDARRDVSPDLQKKMKAYYVKNSDQDEDEFLLSYAILGAQRNLKILGIFARLWLRDGKDIYLSLLPRVWDHLMQDVSHPELRQLKGFILENSSEPTVEIIEQIKGVKS